MTKTPSTYFVAQQGAEALVLLRDVAGPGGIKPGDLDRVKVPAGGGTAWEIPTVDGTEASKSIEGVIVYHHDARAYWSSSMETNGGGSPPDCYSPDGFSGVGEPGGACSVCPHAQFGSDANGRGQACKASKRLYMVLPESALPVIVTLPATSLKNARQYFLRLAARGTRLHQVITKVGLSKVKTSDGIAYSVATFESGGLIDGADAEKFANYASAFQQMVTASAGEHHFTDDPIPFN
jgi:hypothetical protein